MKQGKSCPVFITAAFFVVLAAITLLSIFLPRRAYSETEKRSLRTLPALTAESLTTREESRKFSTNYEAYVADQFLLRDAFVGVKNETERLIGKTDINGVYLGKDGYLFAKEVTAPARFDPNIDAVRRFFEELKQDKNVQNTALMLVPDSAQLYPERLPSFAENYATSPLCETAQTALSDAFLDPLILLSAHKDEELYYRTDHHWTTHGAYYAYTQIADAFGFVPHDRSDYEIACVSESFLGTYAAKVNLPGLIPDRIDRYLLCGTAIPAMKNERESYPSIYFEDALQTSDQYTYFLGKNQAFLEIETDAATDRTLVLVKDSYAHSLVPFLLDHYHRILCIDLRYYEQSVSDLISSIDGPTDVLLLYQTWNFADDGSVFKLAVANKG